MDTFSFLVRLFKTVGVYVIYLEHLQLQEQTPIKPKVYECKVSKYFLIKRNQSFHFWTNFIFLAFPGKKLSSFSLIPILLTNTNPL